MFAFGRKSNIQSNRKQKWLAPQLNKRIKLFEPSQAEGDEGGLEQTYTELKEIWASIRSVSHNTYMRWSSTEEGSASHEFIILKNTVSDLHTQFSTAFAGGYDTIADLNPIKSNMYIMLLAGTTKGRFFKVRRVMNVEENDEYLSMLCEEIEEFGTGLPGTDDSGVL